MLLCVAAAVSAHNFHFRSQLCMKINSIVSHSREFIIREGRKARKLSGEAFFLVLHKLQSLYVYSREINLKITTRKKIFCLLHLRLCRRRRCLHHNSERKNIKVTLMFLEKRFLNTRKFTEQNNDITTLTKPNIKSSTSFLSIHSLSVAFFKDASHKERWNSFSTLSNPTQPHIEPFIHVSSFYSISCSICFCLIFFFFPSATHWY